MCMNFGAVFGEIPVVTAYRIFRKTIDESGKTVYNSLYVDRDSKRYLDTINSADCRPRMLNYNGFWAFKTFNEAQQLYWRDYGHYYLGRTTFVVCRVQLFGHIVVHEHGYRAEYMKITHEYKVGQNESA